MQSSIIINDPQADGRIIVREKHVMDDGEEFIFDYMADPEMDINQRLLDRASWLSGT